MKFTPLLLLVFLFSCKNDTPQIYQQNISDKYIKAKEIVFVVNNPVNNDTIRIGDVVDFSFSLEDTSKTIDYVKTYLNSVLIYSTTDLSFKLPLKQEKVGRGSLGVEIAFTDGTNQRKNVELFFLSDIIPKSIDFTLIDEYPHSTDNFTEGLIFNDGFIYEGAGDWGKSALYKTELESGKIIKAAYLSSNIFGEGISIIGNKIVQLTYKSQEGYVYNKEDFSLIKKFTYSFTSEGWGLTTDGKDLIMSNGTDKLLIMDSTYYSLINERQVCDNEERLDSINELEYVDGIIFANIWMNNKIAKIDYKSGKVLGYIDLSPIVPNGFKKNHENVLNGIAYNPKKKSLLVTGKRWDRIFEIRVEQ